MKALDDATQQAIVDMYQAGLSVIMITEELEGVSNNDVYRILEENGIEKRSPGRRRIADTFDDSTMQSIVNDYVIGVPNREIIIKYGLSNYNTLYNILDELRVQRRKFAPEVVQARNSRLDHAIELYKQGVPIWRIIEETGIDQPKLHQQLHARGVPMRHKVR